MNSEVIILGLFIILFIRQLVTTNDIVFTSYLICTGVYKIVRFLLVLNF